MANSNINFGFHDLSVASLGRIVSFGHSDTQFTYTFENFFHPFVGELIAKLNRDSLPGMLDATWQDGLKQDFFNALYNPTEDNLVQVKYSPKEIDVSEHGSYANYNWELFFHIPLTIAVHLSKTQRFAEAQRWFHYIFDPTSNDHTVDPPKRFWNFLAFRKSDDSKTIDETVRILSIPRSELSHDDQLLQDDILNGYNAIRNKPFQPHAVARTRHLAYQYFVVMKYLDNLIAWGDNLFQQDTVESINEATQLYVLAANVLGERPQQIPPLGTVGAKTFAQLKKGLGPIGEALVDLEGQFPFNLAVPTSGGNGSSAGDSSPLFGIGRTLYFCIPRNDKLLGYWDTVADRLFKIRHCMNIQGVVRPLALFDPPIDPGMLVKAAAAGIDIGSIVSGLNQPIGPLRCLILIQKALELCGEVRNLGNALLSALEKGDAEHLALVRQRHEIQIQQMTQDVRFLQWKSAQETTISLLTSRATALESLHYYQRQLGLPADQNAPDILTLDHRDLTEENFDEAYSGLVGQYDKQLTLQKFPNVTITGDTSPMQQSGASGQGRLYLNTNEDVDLNKHSDLALAAHLSASGGEAIAAVLGALPSFEVEGHFWGVGVKSKLVSGEMFSNIGRAVSSGFNIWAQVEEYQGRNASKTGSYQRRADEWIQQYNLAAHKLMEIGRQILTSLIAEQIAHHEYLNIQQQIANAQEVDQFLHDKFTNEDLYLWMQGEISRLYYEYYRFAFDTARKAERTMKQELMRPEVDAQDFVKFNYWDGGRKGLLSGEALFLDVKRMEMAYHDNNKREYELTRHISLLQVDPIALMQLRTTGKCTIVLPEELFDMDGPGHYFRRIKTVALSIPCVAGPYTSVNCTLMLTKSSIRTATDTGDGYARQGSEDSRFSDHYGSLQAIVTSTAQSDSGMFETNLRDERYLPFENSGVVSEWQLELPSDLRQFDYDTISDVILHVRYTAREGGNPLRKGAVDNLKTLIEGAQAAGSVRLFSIRHDFPTEWARFQGQKPGPNQHFELALNLRAEHYPFWSQGRLKSVKRVDILARSTKTSLDIFDKVDQNDATMKKDSLAGGDTTFGNLLVGKLMNIALPSNPVGEFPLFFVDNTMEDLWIAITWSSE